MCAVALLGILEHNISKTASEQFTIVSDFQPVYLLKLLPSRVLNGTPK